jgi:hypothetical protein
MIRTVKNIVTSNLYKLSVAVVLLFSVFFNSQNLFSQGGSNYSIFGVGDIETSTGSAYESLAGTSIAFPTEHAISSLNPAIWSNLTKTRLLMGYKFNQHLVFDEKDNAIYQNNGKISSLSSVFVIDTGRGIAVSFGLNPYSGVNYLIKVPMEVNFEGLKVTGNSIYQGLGGLTMAYLGASAKIIDNFAFGVSGFATFGVIKSSITTSFNDDNFFTVENRSENKFNGYGVRMGVLYEPVRNLNIGLFSEQHLSLKYDSEVIYNSNFNTDTTKTNSNTVALPKCYGIGGSYLTGKFRIGSDIKLYQLKGMDYNSGPETEYTDMMVYSLGVSRIGSASSGADYSDRVTYNFGLGMKQLYYKFQGEQIKDVFVSFGGNFPLIGTSILDVALTFGNRGLSSKNMVNEFYGRLTIDLSIGEIWFRPIKREY